MKEQGKAHLPALMGQKEDLGLPLFKNPLPQQRLGGHHLVFQVLIGGQFLNKAQNQPCVGLPRVSKGKRIAQVHASVRAAPS
ncbi:hypothetical protein SDC9_131955 [bioreactor metagenome]|uniref:Uncharacterized protein n=1 Tax=bioreactor metagenome TaxID=1076179 RepID=A0A645D6P0_9ZZZZ